MTTLTRKPAAVSAPTAPRPRDVVDYYRQTAADFEPWSAAGNMHFGFHRKGMDHFDREAQVAQMNEEVARRLRLDDADPHRVIDLGCGTGASLRQMLATRVQWRGVGVNVVPEQVAQAREQAREAKLNDRATFLCADFRATSFPPRRFDGAFAIESSCYGCGDAKSDFVSEAARLLKPGGRLVVADAFLRDTDELRGALAYCYARMCKGWELESLARLPSFVAQLKRRFTDIVIEDVSVNVLPTVAHVPGVCGQYFCRFLTVPEAMSQVRWRHGMAPLYGALMGLARRRVGYHLISATRRGATV